MQVDMHYWKICGSGGHVYHENICYGRTSPVGGYVLQVWAKAATIESAVNLDMLSKDLFLEFSSWVRRFIFVVCLVVFFVVFLLLLFFFVFFCFLFFVFCFLF